MEWNVEKYIPVLFSRTLLSKHLCKWMKTIIESHLVIFWLLISFLFLFYLHVWLRQKEKKGKDTMPGSLCSYLKPWPCDGPGRQALGGTSLEGRAQSCFLPVPPLVLTSEPSLFTLFTLALKESVLSSPTFLPQQFVVKWQQFVVKWFSVTNKGR